ncbi:Hypothetical protein R9X50_00345600 [Acrodontium crateriforme]|uniref:Tat pathway signal sequence n=1 Tax=Acrodontium crateriforme TaxID=150365 RepID=A0AAQ3M666_9PEZI|nr:Hypothetical protein R9X50_00345600 [Acrodontium crateriforme]
MPPQTPPSNVPPSRRIALPVSERLNSITEDNRNSPYAGGLRQHVPPIPARNSLRNSGAASNTNSQSQWSLGASTVNTGRTARTAPPAYEWIPEPIPGEDDGNAPVEGEKLAELRRKGPYYRPQRKGGFGRITIIVGVMLLVAIALGVGLGVGLTRRNHNNDESGSGSSGNSTSNAPEPFPLGQYSMISALRTTNTNCTSNPATWRCYPYIMYDQNANASMSTFNWIIANTSATYASNTTTTTTSDQGIPANLTISSTNNPFSISFTNETLTYVSTSSNSSSPRYTFSFSEDKAVIPSTSITTDNSASKCFFNQTTFTGTLYLKAPSTLKGADIATGDNGTPWPFGIEVTENSPGGKGIPTCYVTDNGVVGAEVATQPTPEASSTQCTCEYRNF